MKKVVKKKKKAVKWTPPKSVVYCRMNDEALWTVIAEVESLGNIVNTVLINSIKQLSYLSPNTQYKIAFFGGEEIYIRNGEEYL